MTAENSPRKEAEATAANRAMRRLLSRIAWAVEMTFQIPPRVHAEMLLCACSRHAAYLTRQDGSSFESMLAQAKVATEGSGPSTPEARREAHDAS